MMQTISKKTFQRQIIAMAQHDAVMQYKMYFNAPALKKLQEQCENIESEMIFGTDEDTIRTMLHDLKCNIDTMYNEQFQENEE